MAISDTISSIEDNIRADYEGLENIGGDITGINKNILNIRTILDTIYNDLPKVTGEGTEVTLTPTRKGRLALIPKGNSTQESTTGKNKLPYPNDYDTTKINIRGIQSKGVYKLNGTSNGEGFAFAGPITNYTIQSGDYLHLMNDKVNTGATSAFVLNTTDNTNITISLNAVNRIFDLSSYVGKTISTCLFYINPSSVFDNITMTPMICNSSTSTSWEQYTGGIPAPNPSFPFPIKSVTGENSVVVHTKNLFNKNDIMEGKRVINDGTFVNSTSFNCSNYIEVKPNTTYTLSPSVPLTQFYTLCEYDKNKTFVANKNASSTTYTFTTTATTQYVIVNYAVGDIGNVQLIEGSSVPTDYTPYQNQTLPLNLGTKKMMLDDYIEEGNIKHKRTQVVLNGTQSASKFSRVDTLDTTNYNGFLYNDTSIKQAPNQTVVMIMSDKLKGTGSSDRFSNMLNCWVSHLGRAIGMHLPNTITNVTELLTYLTSNPITIEYELEEEETEALTSEQQAQVEAINKMQSYNGTTIITSTFDSNNAQMIISASGLKGE